jgi:hypothetical protein
MVECQSYQSAGAEGHLRGSDGRRLNPEWCPRMATDWCPRQAPDWAQTDPTQTPHRPHTGPTQAPDMAPDIMVHQTGRPCQRQPL